MTRVALFDTNLSAAPIHAYLVEAGHEVFVIGGNPDDFNTSTVWWYVRNTGIPISFGTTVIIGFIVALYGLAWWLISRGTGLRH